MNETTTDVAVKPAEDPRALEVKELMGDAIERLRGLVQKVDTEETCNLITNAAVDLKTKAKALEHLREQHYEPKRLAVDLLRAIYDEPLKLSKKVMDAASSAVSEYRLRIKREAELAREKAEAEARRIRDEAERKAREAAEAEARAKAQAEARKRQEEEEALRRERAKLDAEKAAWKAAQEKRAAEDAELARKHKEEEDARLAHAEEANRVGNTDKVDTILDRPKPIAAPSPEIRKGPSAEEVAAKERAAKEEQERRERAEQAAADARRLEDEQREEAKRAREDADRAAADAKAAEMAVSAATTVATRPDERTQTSSRYVYRIKDRAAFAVFIKAVAASCDKDPSVLEYAGWKPEKPDAFKTAAIGKDVTRLKAGFSFPGIETWLESKENFRVNEAEVVKDGTEAIGQEETF